MKKKKSLIYISTKPTTFVTRDIEMLKENYQVISFSFYHKSKWFTPLLFLQQLTFILKHILKAKVVFCMFAGYHSFLPAIFCKIFKKPFVIILGGTDSIVIPALNYGILGKGLIGKFARWSYRLTPHFAPVHDSLISSENTYSDIVPRYQGIIHHVHDVKGKITIIPNGFDPDKFVNKKVRRINNSFITVAFDLHKPHLFQLKGADLIIEVAPLFPDCHFTIVGLKHLKKCPDNVHLLDAVSQAELIKLYNQHEFYFQLSLTEGFPNALCEAMLCGCIPIVSDVAAMPEIVKGVGFILKNRDKELLQDLLENEVLNCSRKEISVWARQRIRVNYPLEKRRLNFQDLLEEII